MNKRQKKKLSNRRYEVINNEGHFFSNGEIVKRGFLDKVVNFHNYIDQDGLLQILEKHQVKRTYKTGL